MQYCGIDLVDVARIRSAIDAQGERFLHRVFAPDEIQYCAARRDPFPHYAARFAAKEALYKALPAGTLDALVWNEIAVQHAAGKPEFGFRGATAGRLVGWRFALSLSHTRDLAVAQVLATRG